MLKPPGEDGSRSHGYGQRAAGAIAIVVAGLMIVRSGGAIGAGRAVTRPDSVRSWSGRAGVLGAASGTALGRLRTGSRVGPVRPRLAERQPGETAHADQAHHGAR